MENINDKSSVVDWIEHQVNQRGITHFFSLKEILQQAKEKYEHEMCVFADEYASYILDQSKLGIKGAMVSMCAWTFFKNRRNEQL